MALYDQLLRLHPAYLQILTADSDLPELNPYLDAFRFIDRNTPVIFDQHAAVTTKLQDRLQWYRIYGLYPFLWPGTISLHDTSPFGKSFCKAWQLLA